MGLAASVAGMARKARLFGRGDPKAAPQRTPGAVTYLSMGDPGANKRLRNYSSYLGAITIPDVYKCCSVLAQNFASAALRVLDEDDEEIDVKQRLPAFWELLRRPNPEMRGRHFLQLLSHHYELTGNAVCLRDNYSGLGYPTELWPLRPDRLYILRSDVGKLAYGYEIEENKSKRILWYPGESILHVKTAHPSDDLFGLGVIEAGELSFSKNRLVNEFALNFFSRGAIVDGVLTTDREIPEDDRLAIVADFKAMREGARNKMRTALLWSGATYTPIQEPLGNVPVMDLTKMGRNDICELFGVPPQLLGDFSDTNYRNAQESNAFFWGETMAPILAQFAEDFWNPLLEDFDPSLRAEYEQREVIDYQMRADAATKLAATGAFAVNDLRVAAGYDPLPDDDELGAMIPLPKGMTLLSPEQALALGEEVQEAPEELPPAPQVTELGQPATQAGGEGREAREGEQGQQASSGAENAQERPAGKSAYRAMRGQKSYPAALLSPQARAEQRRRTLLKRQGQDAFPEGAPGRAGALKPPHLRLLPGAKAPAQADASDAASAPALSGARAAPGPPRPAGANGDVDAAVGPSTKAKARTVSARPTADECERLKRVYLQWSEDDDEAWRLAVQGAEGEGNPRQAGQAAAEDGERGQHA